MHPDLYEDIQRTLEGLKRYLDDNPLETESDIEAYSFAYQAGMYLEWFLNVETFRRRSDESQS